jgi:threonine dehydrogenase-like Zn-dependent dehydrogenase
VNAVVLQRAGDLAVRAVPEPAAAAGEVLVEVAWCGICGTDRSIFHGAYGGRHLPLTLGHEFSGRVAGDPSGRLAPGTPVVADINITCGRCRSCRLGDTMTCPQLRQIGVDRDGAFAPLVSVPASAVHVLPADLPLDIAAMTEPLACVVHSQAKLTWSPGSSALVIGAGPVGLLQAQLAGTRGCTRVMVADVLPERLAALESFPGLIGIDAREDAAARTRELTDGEGADVVIEASGAARAWATAFDAVRAGGQILAFGIPGPRAEVPMRPHDVLVRELSIRGSNGAGPAAWPVAIELLASGRIDVSRLLAERIDLDAVVERITSETLESGFKSLANLTGVAA